MRRIVSLHVSLSLSLCVTLSCRFRPSLRNLAVDHTVMDRKRITSLWMDAKQTHTKENETNFRNPRALLRVVETILH